MVPYCRWFQGPRLYSHSRATPVRASITSLQANTGQGGRQAGRRHSECRGWHRCAYYMLGWHQHADIQRPCTQQPSCAPGINVLSCHNCDGLLLHWRRSPGIAAGPQTERGGSQRQQQGCLRSKNGQGRNEWASLGGTWVLQASNRHRQQWNLVSAQRREGSGRGAYPCCHACQPRKLG